MNSTTSSTVKPRRRTTGTIPPPVRAIANLGYPVFPQHQDRGGYVKWGQYREKPPTRDQMRRWHKRHPNALWAVITGQETRLIVLDFDGDDGVATMARLGLAPYVKSSSGGRHVWVHAPDFPVKSGSRVDEANFPGLDVKAEGGCATFRGPRNGGRYTLDDDRRIYAWEELPAGLREMLEQRVQQPPAEPVEIPDDFDGYAPANILLREAVSMTGPGLRNNVGFHLACQLRDERYSENAAMATMKKYADKVTELSEDPYTYQEAYNTIQSAFSEPARTPRGLRPLEGSGPELEIGGFAEMADWLQQEIGRNRLAGLFRRGMNMVYTPREGEEGYVPLTGDKRNYDGLAQVHSVKHGDHLAALVYYEYTCHKVTKDKARTKVLFPAPSARTAFNAIEKLPNLRWLKGVIHTPIVRENGTIFDTPGYDAETGLLYLPNPDISIPKTPANPTRRQIKEAASLLQEMADGFPFVTEHDEANFYGFLLTPLLRSIAPPPYKIAIFDAHMRRSGKSLLAWIGREIHGGVFRVELPDGNVELSKQLSSILGVTTGPIVTFDNVTGPVKSSVLAGLTTSDVWQDRTLGSTKDYPTFANDRVWSLTSNNAKVGGDLAERSFKITIDPDQPHPERRTDFKIKHLKTWVRQHHGELIAALLTLIRAWVVAGRPMPEPDRSDDYATWISTVRGILGVAGVQGVFDHDDTAVKAGGVDDEEWFEFLSAVFRAFSTKDADGLVGEKWKVKDILNSVGEGRLSVSDGHVGIPMDALPDEVEKKALRDGVTACSRTLGKWVSNREGWYVGDDESGYLAVRQAGEKDHVKLWQIVKR